MLAAPPMPVTDLQPVRIAQTGAYATSVAVLPARGDAPVRIVAGDQRGGLIVVRRRRDGQFGRFRRRADIQIHALAVADLDGDGRDDLVAGGSPREGLLALSVRWGGRNGALSRAQRLPMPALDGGATAAVAQVRIADIDGDARLDIVAADGIAGASPPRDRGVAILYNRGHRRFALRTPTTARSADNLVVTDLDGDRHRDLLAGGRPYRQRHGGRFIAGPRHGDHAVSFSELGDTDGDGRADLIYSLNGRLAVRHGGRRGFGPRRLYRRELPGAAEGVNEVYRSAAGDLDGDGRAELVLAQDDKIDVLRPDRHGVPGTATPHELAYEQRGVAVADTDGDGSSDVVTADSGGTIVVLRNRGLRPRSATHVEGAPVLIAADRSLLIGVQDGRRHTVVWGASPGSSPRRSEHRVLEARPKLVKF